jgi:hypothetical protein
MAVAFIAFATSSFGGEIYGTITIEEDGGRSVAKGVKLEIKRGDSVYPTATDEFGNYRVIVVETGKCAITVEFKGQSMPGEIQSYWSSVRFDWVLEKTGEKYSLKRE